ncbi:hypothetical protein COB72_04525 [bacterium]|nr:MAG: hypothetical protein COB72_04525 [bacterium]
MGSVNELFNRMRSQHVCTRCTNGAFVRRGLMVIQVINGGPSHECSAMCVASQSVGCPDRVKTCPVYQMFIHTQKETPRLHHHFEPTKGCFDVNQ